MNNRFRNFENRENIPIYAKTEPKPEAAHLVKYKTKILYKFYRCDYCGNEIKILKNSYEMSGGIVVIPHTVTRRGEIRLALCNKCLNPVLKEFERCNNNAD